jgi:hypothetical protein
MDVKLTIFEKNKKKLIFFQKVLARYKTRRNFAPPKAQGQKRPAF